MNSFHTHMKVKIVTVAIDGRASGSRILVKICQWLAPSMRAASLISVGTALKKLRRTRMPKEVQPRYVKISAQYVSTKCRTLIHLKPAMTIACGGTIRPMSMNAKSESRPRNDSMENAYAP